MLRIFLSLFLSFVFSITTQAQDKYFHKIYAPANNNNAHVIEQFGDDYFLMGGVMKPSDGTWDTFIYQLNEFGDSIKFETINYEERDDSVQESIIIGSNLYTINNIIPNYPTPIQLLISEYDNNMNLLDTTYYEPMAVEDVFNLGNKVILAGRMRLAPEYKVKPVLYYIDIVNKEAIDYKSYDNWLGQEAYCWGFAKTEEYIYAIPNIDLDSYDYCDTYLMKFDLEGNEIETYLIPKQGYNYFKGNRLLSLKNGNILGGFQVNGSTQFPDAYLVFFDGEGNVINTKDNFLPNTSIIKMTELDKGSLLFGTSKFDPDYEQYVDIGIVKTDSLGNILWEQYYGGTSDDYVYDMKVEEDGSILLTGRYESGPGTSTYLLKTNCLGLLTEPHAQFSFELPIEENLKVQFNNESENVYETQSDGGHYIWDFGDGEISNEINPLHQFCEAGTYEVNLTAVVCQDTSVYNQVIQVTGTADCTGVSVGELNNQQFSISPNPASNQLFINSELNKPVKYEIFDLTGKSYLRGIAQNEKPINITAFTSGIYILILENGEEHRFVKE